MAWCESFSPRVNAQTRIVILGSMPGIKSLTEAQYYAHPRNAFWAIMEALFAINKTLPYEARLQALNQNGVGLWDVYARCFREGSLDASIQKGDAQVNNFSALFEQYPNIHAVFFNGKAAEQAFRKQVGCEHFPQIRFFSLPSTSPANASLNFAQKLACWQQIKVEVSDAA